MAAPAPESTFSSLRLLLAEDDAFIREATVSLIEAQGVSHIETAEDGNEALQRMTSGEQPAIDLALVDLQMPFMDGLDCVRQLRAWELSREADRSQLQGRRRTRVIALSANCDQPGVRKECADAGFDEAIEKPLTQDRLRSLLLCSSAPQPDADWGGEMV